MKEKVDFVVVLEKNKSAHLLLEWSDEKARFISTEGAWACEILKSNHSTSQDPMLAPFENYPGLSKEYTQKILSEISGRGHISWLLKRNVL